MNKKLLFVVAIIFVATLFVGAAVNSYAKTSDDQEAERVVFYDETINEVVGIQPEAPSLWMLPEGEHEVITHDGSTMTVLAENGSWRYIQ